MSRPIMMTRLDYDRVVNRIDRLGMTHAEVAKRMGRHPSSLSRMLRAAIEGKPVRIDSARLLADALGTRRGSVERRETARN